MGRDNACSEEIERALGAVRLLVLDVDGVLTDGGLYYTEAGEGLKRFNVRDGLGIRLLMDNGVDVAVVSARASGALRRRCEELGIAHVRFGCRDKLGAVTALAEALGVALAEVAFIGDDLIDVPVLRAVGLGVAVADAHPAARAAARWVTALPGGGGAAREVADRIAAERVGLEAAQARYLERERARGSTDRTGALEFGVVIPARYASTRLPGKPLREIGGKPMVVHVLERARQSGAAFVRVATDDARIADAVTAAGGEAMLTSVDHASGTDRLAEVVERLCLPDDAVIVNVQGDEPLIEPELIAQVARSLIEHPSSGMATLATPIDKPADLFDPNCVKVVLDQAGRALYFSRAPVPWLRAAFGEAVSGTIEQVPEGLYLRHLGLYAYRAGTLRRLSATAPVPIERAESLEQLRALWLGIAIQVAVVPHTPSLGVDTEADLRRAEQILLRA